MKKLWTVGLSLLGSAVAFAGVTTVREAPVIDGRLDEKVWADAEWESGFRRFRNCPSGRAVKADTSFAIVADAENVYFAAKCAEPDMAAVRAEPPTGIFGSRQNSIELVFAPDGTDFDYYQFVMTFHGETHAMFYSEGGNIRPDPYGPAWESRIGEWEGGWTIEAKFPLAAFYMTRDANWRGEWLLGVSRTRCNEGFSSWCDFEKGFKEPRNLRRFAGFPKRRAEEDVWVKSVDADIAGKRNGKVVGKLKLGIAAAKGGEVELTTPFTGTVRAKLVAGANDFAFDAVFPENGRHALPVTLKRVGEDVTMARTYPVIVDYEAIRVKLSLPQYRDNFYPGQDTSRIAGCARFSGGGKATAHLVIPDIADETVEIGADGAFAFKVDDRGAAAWDGRIEFRCGDDRKDVRVRKLAPLKDGGQMSWVENGRLIVDGKPLFRRNMYAEYYRGGEAFKRRYDADDLHLTHNFRRIATLEPGRLIKGMEQKEATKDMKPCDEIFAKMAEVIEKGKDGKSGAYYYISDEPECRMVSPVYLKWMYEFAKEKDPYHVLLTCTRAGERYIDCADVLEPHPYINPYVGKDGRRAYGRDFNVLGSFVDACKPEKHPDKCIGGAQACFCSGRGLSPTLDEYILNTWCLLLRGSRTFFPYAYHDLGDNADLYEGTRYVFSSVEALADFFLDGKRQTLCRTEQAECGLWTLGGEKLVAVVNFTDRPQTVAVKGLSGRFVEFRGSRTFESPSAFALKPHETIVATTAKRDAGLPTYVETKARVAELERTRLAADNQLKGRFEEVEVTASKGKASRRKLFDGVRDVFAWGQPGGAARFLELSFPKFTPAFTRLAVHGWHLGDMKVKARIDGDWKEIVPVKRDSAEFHEILEFGETVRTVKLRLEFPQKQVEVYEIELPGTCVTQSAASGARDRGEFVSLGEVKTSENKAVSWTRPEGYDYLTFDFAEPQRIAAKAYTAWGVSQPKKLSLFSAVTTPLAGRYTLRLPPSAGKKEPYLWRTRNLALDIRDVRFAKEPLDRVDFTEKDGTYAIRLTLAAPCEDVTCKFLTDVGRGPSALSVNGRSSCDLKPLDATRRVWGTEIQVKRIDADVPERFKKEKYRPFIKVSVLGGGLDTPIFANMYKN